MLKPTFLLSVKMKALGNLAEVINHHHWRILTLPLLCLSDGIRSLPHPSCYSSGQFTVKSSAEVQRRKDCRTLGVPENCQDEGLIRDAYIKLAKRFHPDSGTPDACASKFQEIDAAYRNFLKYFADFRHNRHKIEGEYGLYYKAKRKGAEKAEDAVEEEIELETPDIKHTAPQHRQYLSFDGVGTGTPRQREKQYQKWRAMKAADNVIEHKLEQVSRSSGRDAREIKLAKEQEAAKKIKTGIGVERLVEDMIQDAMARGDFDNLSGKGKPLNSRDAYNPYIDFTTHKLNQVLIDNGFAPEWIMLEKEIKEEVVRIRTQLREIRHIFGEVLTSQEQEEWSNCVQCLNSDCDKLNKSILKFNLTVPSLHKQVMGFQLEKEAQKALKNFDSNLHKVCLAKEMDRKIQTEHERKSASKSTSVDTLMGSILSMFKM